MVASPARARPQGHGRARSQNDGACAGHTAEAEHRDLVERRSLLRKMRASTGAWPSTYCPSASRNREFAGTPQARPAGFEPATSRSGGERAWIGEYRVLPANRGNPAGGLEPATLPICGEFGRVWADGALRLPNAELLAGSAANGSETRVGAPSRRRSSASARNASARRRPSDWRASARTSKPACASRPRRSATRTASRSRRTSRRSRPLQQSGAGAAQRDEARRRYRPRRRRHR